MGTEYPTIYSRLATLPKGHQILLIMINTLASLACLVIIPILCHGIIKTKLSQAMSFRFILALSISDICISFIQQTLLSIGYGYAFIIENRAYGLQIATQFSSFTFCQFSGGMILIIAFDRYLHMRYLNRYMIIMTSKRANILIAINFTYCLVCGLLFTVSSSCGFQFYVHFVFLSLDVVILLTTISLYFNTFYSLKRRIANSSLSKLESDNLKRNIQRADLKLAKRVSLIAFSLSVFFMPFLVTGLVHLCTWHVEKDYRSANQSFSIGYLWFIELVSLAPLTNALLLIMLSKKLRHYVLRKMTCKAYERKQPPSENV